MARETIFALSSGAGAAGVAIIRLSGDRAVTAAECLVGPLPAPRRAALRDVVNPANGEKIDSAVILFFRSPHSFTGEDLVELQLHGSVAVVRATLSILGSMEGLRLAESGEFTARAFENGKMDLVEVEALADLLASETLAQARFAQQYQARLKAASSDWRARLLDLLAITEAYIDFSDEGDVSANAEDLGSDDIRALGEQVRTAMSGFAVGERMRLGFRVAILGEPNVGKSSLLNALVARDVAIVSAVPGTTRDIVEVHLDLGGVPVILIDTAGLRETDDPVELEGMSRARKAAANAELKLWLSRIDHPSESPFEGCVSVGTMADMIDSPPLRQKFEVCVSTRSPDGLDALLDMLRKHAAGWCGAAGHVIVASERQFASLNVAALAMERSLGHDLAELELRAEDLRMAIRALDSLVGRVDVEDVLGAIFSRFCIGK